MSIMGAAGSLGVGRQLFSDFVNEKVSLSAELALKIEKTFGFSMDTLMDMQTRFDIATTRQRDRAIQNQQAARSPSQPGRNGLLASSRRSAA